MTKISEQIYFFNRYTNKQETESVYGGEWVKRLYQTKLGQITEGLLSRKPISFLYGLYQDTSMSKFKIPEFLKNYNIDLDEFQQDEPNTMYKYGSFNDFFIRKFKEGKRSFPKELKKMGAFAEGRYIAYEKIHPEINFPIKGKDISYPELLKNSKWDEIFKDGCLMISRLCPVDYHRFHFPCSGKILDSYTISGRYHSVNPWALQAKGDIFLKNERQITIFESSQGQKMAMVEVGALCVGKIKQTHLQPSFSKGDEKGLFLFGGSTVIMIFEKNSLKISKDILENTQKKLETYIQLGDTIGEVNS